MYIDMGHMSAFDGASAIATFSPATSRAQKVADGRALRAEKDEAALGMKCWLQPQRTRCPPPR